MQSNQPLLTIAIPTYNRERYLRELLSILLDQLINEPRVELIVSDNASPDETPAIIEEYQRRGLQVRSIRNETNIGADANFLQCFEQARGKYVWIFGDDDIIVPGGIAMILSHLELKDFDLVYVCSFPIASSNKSYAFKSTSNAMEFDDAKPFVKRIHIYFTFISGNIINKDRLRSVSPSSFSALLGTNLVQLSWIYAALNSFQSGLYIQEKLIGARVDNTGGYKLTEVFGSRLTRVTEQSLHSPHLRKLIINGTVQRFWPGMLLNYRRTNKLFEKDASLAKALTKVFKDNPRYWFFVYPILALPTVLGTCWFFLVRILNRIDKALGFIL